MLSINRITYFQNKSRIRFLTKFRDKLSEYFDNAKMNTYVESRIENERAKKLRQEINFDIEKAARTITAAFVDVHIRQYPPPMVGGPVLDIDLIRNVFHSYIGVSNVHVFDTIDKAIGAYQTNNLTSITRTVNPFFYIDHLLTYLTSFILHPFRPLLHDRPFSIITSLLKVIEYAFLLYQVYTQIVVKYIGSLL